MAPSATRLRPDIDLSKTALATVRGYLDTDGADLTFVYLVSTGEVDGPRAGVALQPLDRPGGEALVLTSAHRTAVLECGPVSAWAPGECRDFNGLWNSALRAAAGVAVAAARYCAAIFDAAGAKTCSISRRSFTAVRLSSIATSA